jgi:hypothetical protein
MTESWNGTRTPVAWGLVVASPVCPRLVPLCDLCVSVASFGVTR